MTEALDKGCTAYEKLTQAQRGQKEFRMKRSMTRKRHRTEEFVTNFIVADEA